MISNISHNTLTHFHPNQKISFIWKVHIWGWKIQKKGHTVSIKTCCLLLIKIYISLSGYRAEILQFEKQPHFFPCPYRSSWGFYPRNHRKPKSDHYNMGCSWDMAAQRQCNVGLWSNKDFIMGHPDENTACYSGLTSSKYTVFEHGQEGE